MAGDIAFVHDGSETAPSYEVSVSDATTTTAPVAASITFVNVNDAPVLGANGLTIGEGQTVVLGAGDLSATDAETSSGALEFQVSSVQGGFFQRGGAGASVTSFTQAEVVAGDIAFVHDGSETAPSYAVAVFDGTVATSPVAASITFMNVDDAPVIAGGVGSQAVDDDGFVDPFGGVTITNAEGGQSVTVDVQLDDAAKGDLTNLGGFTEMTPGLYRFVGSASDATTALQALRFVPTANRVAVGASETTTFTITANDGINAAVSDSTTTVVALSVNDASSIANATAGQAVDDDQTIAPFSAVVLADADPGTTLDVAIQLDDAAKGVLTNLSGFVDEGGGRYRFGGDPASATAAIRQLRFDPANDRVVVGANETTGFRITVDDGSGSIVSDALTTVVATSINDPAQLVGTGVQGTTDAAALQPFQGVTLSDPDIDELTVEVRIDDPAKGSFANPLGFTEIAPGRYRFSGSAAQATVQLRLLRFVPEADRLPVGASETVQLSVAVSEDGATASILDSATAVDVTSQNDAPIGRNAALSSPLAGDRVDTIFEGGFSDPDVGSRLSGVVVVSNPSSPGDGEWQYSADGGASWSAVGAVSEGSALSLDGAARLRFVANPGYAGIPDPIGVRVLDEQWSGGFSSGAGRLVTDASGAGGSSSIAGNVSRVVASRTAIGVNDIETDPEVEPEVEPELEPEIETHPEGEPEPEAEPEPEEPVAEADPTGPVDVEPIPEAGGPGVAFVPRGDVRFGLEGPEAVDRQRALQRGQHSTAGGASASVQVSLAGTPFVVPATSFSNFVLAGGASDFARELDAVQVEFTQLSRFERGIVTSTAAVSSGLSVGYVIWLTRGGLLVASLMSSMPAWRLIDPDSGSGAARIGR